MIYGYVDRIVLTTSSVVISGWARQPELDVPAERVVVKNAAGEVIADTLVNIERRDVALTFKRPDLLYCGWSAQVNLDNFTEGRSIQAFVIIDSNEHRLLGNPIPKQQHPKMLGGYDLETLIARGLTIGSNFSMQPECFIDYSHCWLICIGNNVIFAPRVQVIAHDASLLNKIGSVKIGLIKIGNNVFIGNGAIILLGVSIGDDCIIGAGSVVTKSIPSGCVAAGNPAQVICKINETIRKNSTLQSVPVFDNSFTIEKKLDSAMKKTMIDSLKASGGIGYIRRTVSD